MFTPNKAVVWVAVVVVAHIDYLDWREQTSHPKRGPIPHQVVVLENLHDFVALEGRMLENRVEHGQDYYSLSLAVEKRNSAHFEGSMSWMAVVVGAEDSFVVGVGKQFD
jgi:hypothetical protein